MVYLKYIYTTKNLKLIIDEDTVGYYLIVYRDPCLNESSEDYLLDTLEEAFEEAKEKFDISRKQWNLA